MIQEPEESSKYSSNGLAPFKNNSKKYHQILREFLQIFKVYKCNQQSEHNFQLCLFYHDHTDQRRDPYQNHQFLYDIPELCSCDQQDCAKVHNQYENFYHPLIYKTVQCENYHNCKLGLFCSYLHRQDFVHFEYGEFFRFDLRTFKTKRCHNKNQHERKTCLYYHNDKDKRRPSYIEYSHFNCSKEKCTQENCEFAHNKLEQLYHPNRYKTKFCQFYPNDVDKCQYRDFCSFAHTENEIKDNIQLIHLEEKNNDFYINKYKTVWCPFTQNHERDKCPYAHNIQDYRRDPNVYQYEAVRCDMWNFSDQIKSIDGAGCKLGMSCKKCHGWMELRYHPSKFNLKSAKGSLKKEEFEHAENFIQKKLIGSNYTEKNKNSANIGYQLKNGSKGAPFFKHDKCSEYSAKTKAKSINIESDKSNDGSYSVKDQARNNAELFTSPNISFLEFQDHLWKQNQAELQSETNKEVKEESVRSKSAQKSDEYEIFYSNSMKNALEDDQILKELRRQKYNEIQIVNMDEKKINKITFLTSDQKSLLTKKLRNYNLKNSNAVSYSKELTTYFVTKKKEHILEKMQMKRVKEPNLMKLKAKEINALSFLEEEEKSQLPKLLKDFENDREFNDLNKRIVEETKMK